MKKLFIILLFVFPAVVCSQLKINELMTNNVSAVLDNGFNYSMWVEVHNTGSTATSVSYYYFTDDLTVPKKWKPTYAVVPANGFAVLWFERPKTSRHATFKLNPEGGRLFLLQSSLKVLDSVYYPAQYRNVSYGRKTDDATEWVFFEPCSPGFSNNNKHGASERCVDPVFELMSGFYSSPQTLEFGVPKEGDTIYYTRNGSEPTRKSYLYVPGTPVKISATTCVRAKTFSKDKLSSDVVTSTYFIKLRDMHLPVVSIVTDKANLTDDSIGIYVVGKNGITGNGSNTPVNFNRDWDRPVNFEFFDTTGVSRLNQELDIAICGGWSRLNPQKSLQIKPRMKFGDNRLRYDFFAATKFNRKYKDVQLRNSGNDFYYTMMRDGFMQSLVIKRMNLDGLAYEPAVLYVNGSYYGIQNLREVSSDEYLYSNYGLDGDDVYMLESGEIDSDTAYAKLSKYISGNNIARSDVYKRVGEAMDIDEYINYMISEMYFGNTDWPGNNVKIWRRKAGGKWRWILYDTDFGFSLYDTELYKFNSLLYVLGEKKDQVPSAWSTLLFRRLVLNPTFRNTFIDRFCVHLSTTFETNRVNAVMDSLAGKITKELSYHRNKWGSPARNFSDDLVNMKNFSAKRPDKMLEFLSNRLADSADVRTIHLTSNVPGVSFRMNAESTVGPDIRLKYFNGRSLTLKTDPLPGFRFKEWNRIQLLSRNLISMGDTWKYFDGNALPAVNWSAPAYNDSAWKTGQAPLGYGGLGEKTTVDYGGNKSSKYPSVYFRKTVVMDSLAEKNDFFMTALVDDGVAVYVNGNELSRFQLPSGELTFNTLATVSSGHGSLVTFPIPKEMLHEGENLIAAEVHQYVVGSSDLVFDLQWGCGETLPMELISSPVYVDSTGNVELEAIFDVVNPEDTVDVSTVLINELVANNSLYADDFGEYDDYIELYNTGEKAVDVAGWYLTDIPENRKFFQIPATDSSKTTLQPKGRLVLWADDDPVQSPLHLGFKLGQSGETVVLSRINAVGDFVTVDSVDYPALELDASYSRKPDGGEWGVYSTTCNYTNNDAVGVENPTYSVSRVVIFPTLVNESFTVCNAEGMPLTVVNLTGRTVLRLTCLSSNEVVSTEDFVPGWYLVVVGTERWKIVKYP